LRDKEMTKIEVGRAIRELEKDWYEVFVKIQLEDMVAEKAAALALEYSLKGADAVHLASARASGVELFVASDEKLIHAAEDMGMAYYNPLSGSYRKSK